MAPQTMNFNDSDFDDETDSDDCLTDEELEMLEKLRQKRKEKSSSPRRKRSLAKRMSDMARISSLITAGASIEEVAKELDISVGLAQRELMEINQIWAEEIAQNSERYRSVFLNQLLKLQVLALESFEESKTKNVTEVMFDETGKIIRRTVKTFESSGDSSFLALVSKTIQQQADVIGLDKQKTNVIFDKDAFIEEVAKTIKEAKANAAAIPVVAKDIQDVELPKGQLVRVEEEILDQ